MKRKLALVIATVMALALVLTACGKTGGANPTPPPQGGSSTPAPSTPTNVEAQTGTSDETLVVGLGAEPVGLVDCINFNSNVGAVTSTLYDTLVWYNSTTGKVEPMIAKSWEWEDDCTILLQLRDDVKDLKGNPITAEDVMFSLQNAKANRAEASYYDLDNSEIVSDYTIRLRTYSPYSQAVDALANKAMAIVSKAETDAAGGLEACMTNAAGGTGMYKVKEWVTGEKLVVERNENYYGEPGYYKTIEFRFIPDAATRTMALQSGDVDVAYGIPSAMMEEIDKTEGIDALQIKAPVVLAAAVNLHGQNSQYMSDPAVRKALSMAINREAVLGVAYLNYGEVSDSMYPSHHYLYQAPSAEDAYTFDPEGAKKVLADAGYGENEITVNILVNATHYTTVAEVVQNNLSAIGINVELNILEVSSWIAESGKGQYDIILSNFYSSNPTDVLKTIDGNLTYASRNYTGLNDPEANEIVATAIGATDEAATMAAFKDFVDYIVYDQNLCIPLCSHNTLFGVKEGLTNIYLNTQGDHAFYGMIRPAA